MWKFPIEKLTFEQMGRYFPRLKSGKWRGGYNDFFYYPVSGGIQSLCDAIPVKNLSLDTEVEKIDLKDKMVFFRKGKIRGETPFSSLISTLPLKKLVLDIVEDVPSRVRDAARKLKCSSVLNINLGIERERITDKHWIYFPEKRFIFYRAGFPMNFSENVVPRGTSSIYTEVSYRPEEKRQVLKNSKKIVRQVIEDLIEAGVLRRGDGISAEVVLEMEYAYVLCDSYYRKSVKIMKDYLEKNSIYSTGRYGAWKYSGMDDAILDGKEAAGWIEKKLRT